MTTPHKVTPKGRQTTGTTTITLELEHDEMTASSSGAPMVVLQLSSCSRPRTRGGGGGEGDIVLFMLLGVGLWTEPPWGRTRHLLRQGFSSLNRREVCLRRFIIVIKTDNIANSCHGGRARARSSCLHTLCDRARTPYVSGLLAGLLRLGLLESRAVVRLTLSRVPFNHCIIVNWYFAKEVWMAFLERVSKELSFPLLPRIQRRGAEEGRPQFLHITQKQQIQLSGLQHLQTRPTKMSNNQTPYHG